MNISRGTYYNHKNNPDLSYEQLAKYGKVLNHDFSEEMPEMKKFILEEPDPVYNEPKTIKEAIKQRDYWKEKYYQLLEEYHQKELGNNSKR